MENGHNPLWYESVDVDEEILVNPEKAACNLFEDIKCLLEGHISKQRVDAYLSEHGLIAVPLEATGEMLDELTNGDAKKNKVMKLRYSAMIAAQGEG